jgi:hypothetical protein
MDLEVCPQYPVSETMVGKDDYLRGMAGGSTGQQEPKMIAGNLLRFPALKTFGFGGWAGSGRLSRYAACGGWSLSKRL